MTNIILIELKRINVLIIYDYFTIFYCLEDAEISAEEVNMHYIKSRIYGTLMNSLPAVDNRRKEATDAGRLLIT